MMPLVAFQRTVYTPSEGPGPGADSIVRTIYHWPRGIASGRATTLLLIWLVWGTGSAGRLAAAVDHFEWGAVPSPQFAGSPFAVTLTARDDQNGLVTNYTGPVTIQGFRGEPPSTDILWGNPRHYDMLWGSWGAKTGGFAFTPAVDLWITHVRHYFGERVSVWSDDGVLLADRAVQSDPGVWRETPLVVPVRLSAGRAYRVTVRSELSSHYYQTNRPTEFAHGVLGPSYLADEDGFPTGVTTNYLLLVDLRYTVEGESEVPVVPGVTGDFQNGTWSGDLAVPQAIPTMSLRADDGLGHRGDANRFAVLTTNDIGVVALDSPGFVTVGDRLRYRLAVTNTGPEEVAGITTTNELPATVTFVSAQVSQGTYTNLAGGLMCGVGAVSGGGRAEIIIDVIPSSPGIVAIRSGISRQGLDGDYRNNALVAVTRVYEVPSLSISDTQVVEGKDGTNAIVTAWLSSPSSVVVSAAYQTTNGTATAGVDYLSSQGTLVFPPGTTNTTLSVPILGDLLNEVDETFVVQLKGATNASIAWGGATVRIVDDDPLPSMSVADASLGEGSGGTNQLPFVITLSAVSGRTVTAAYATAGVTASPGLDFVPVWGTVTFPPGTTQATVSVPIKSDFVREADETLVLGLSQSSGATLARAQAVGTLVDDDGDAGGFDHFAWDPVSPLQVASRSFPAGVRALDATGQIASNYQGSASLSAWSGTPRQPVRVLSFIGYADPLQEPPRTLGAIATWFGDFTEATMATTNASEMAAMLAVQDVFLIPAQRAAPTNAMANLGQAWSETLSDFVAQGGLVVVCGSDRQEQQILAAAGLLDVQYVRTRPTLVVTRSQTHSLSSGVAASFTGTNITTYTRGTNGATVFRDGSNNAVVTSRDVGTGHVVLIGCDYARPGSALDRVLANAVQWARGTALPVAPSAPIIFTNGLWTGSLSVSQVSGAAYLIADDNAGHPAASEPFRVAATNDLGLAWRALPPSPTVGSNVTLELSLWNTGPTATGVLVTNQLPSALSLVSVDLSQGACTTNSGQLVCSLGSLTNGAVALITLEAIPVATGTLTVLAAGRRSEPETNLTNNTATIYVAVLPPLTITISDAVVTEGAAEQSVAHFDVTLSVESTNTVTVDFATVDGTARDGTDYRGTAGTLVFPPYVTRQTISVPILNDDLIETNKQFVVRLSNPTNAPLARTEGVGTIVNDDLPALSIVDITLLEGDAGTSPAGFEVTLSEPAPFAVSVRFATADGTAREGADYLPVAERLDFPPGATRQIVTVQVVGDRFGELTEEFFLRLSDPVNATLLRESGTATVLDNDPSALSIEPTSVIEGDSGVSEAVFRVRLVPAADQTATARYATEDGTAVAGEDYQSVSGSLLFPPGVTLQEIRVPVVGDRLNEADETFFVRLSQATQVPIGTGVAGCIVRNDDPQPSLTIGSVSAPEGHSGVEDLHFPVTLSAVSGQLVTVGFATSDGTAVAGEDYVATRGTLVFPPGTTTQEVVVPVLGDRLVETNETFFVSLTAPQHATLQVSQGLGTIVDDDAGAGVFHHLEWAPIPSPQVAGRAFTVHLTAVDVDGWVVPDLTNSVTLGAAKASGPESFTIEGTLSHNSVATVAPSTWGYRFTPGTNLLVTHFRHYTGTRISLWTDAGERLASEDVEAPAGQWQEVPLAQPVRLLAGRPYRLALYTGGEAYYETYNTVPTFPHGTMNQNCSGAGDTFPSLNGFSIRPLVDIRYSVDQFFAGAVSPGVSGPFTNGSWSGAVTLTTEPDSVYLWAGAAGGQTGASPLFDLEYANDIALSLAAFPNPVDLGGQTTLTLLVTNTGPGAASNVMVTHSLPPGLSLLAAIPSQGNWSLTGGQLIWNAGDLSAGTAATLAIDSRADLEGVWTNAASAQRGEADAWTNNNQAQLAVQVDPPLHHFAFAPLAATEQTRIAFPATVTARDRNNRRVVGFQGTVSVRGSTMFQEDFEDGELAGWSVGSSFGDTVLVTNVVASTGNNYLYLAGLPGVSRGLGSMRPDRMEFRVRTGQGSTDVFLDLVAGPNEPDRVVHLQVYGGQMSIIDGAGQAHSRTAPAFNWYRVALIFHWTAQTVDFYVDDLVVERNIPFYGSAYGVFADSLQAISVYNWFSCESWWDDIVFSAASAENLAVAPLTLGPFTNGIWSGDLSVMEVATNAQLEVSDGAGHRGLSAAFTVVPGPHGTFDHLAWDPVPSPILATDPLRVTLRAVDVFGNVATNFGGPAQISAKRRGTLEILAFAGYSDFGAGFSNWLAVASAGVTNSHMTITTNLDLYHLNRDLVGKDVLLIPYQRYATLEAITNLAAMWRDDLGSFVRAGGVVACDASAFLSASGLMQAEPCGSTGWTWVRAAQGHFLTQGVAASFEVSDLVAYFRNSDADVVISIAAGGEPVVLSRDLGLGHVVLCGTSFFNIGSPMDRVLANSVRWAQRNGLSPVSLTVPNSVTLVNGTWSGEVRVPEPADELYLYADAGGLRTAFSNPFAVGVTNDLALSLSLSTNQLIIGTPLTCTLLVTNHGTLSATGVVVTNPLPSNTVLSFLTTSQGPTAVSDGEWICQLGTLAGGGQAMIVFTLIPNATGTITNRATVSRIEPDFFAGNNEAIGTVQVWPPPSLAVLDVQGDEGRTNALRFSVRLFPPAATNVLVDWRTQDGNASGGLDYVPAEGRLTFPPGATNLTADVVILDDTLSEDDETFFLVLTNAVNATIATTVARGTIRDDADPFPLFLMDSEALDEGDAGARNMIFTSRLSTPSGRTVSVHYRTIGASATAGQDFVAVEGDLVFPPGSTQQTVAVPILGDVLSEPDEVFLVELSAPTNATLTYTQCGGVIRDDDAVPGRLDHFTVGHVVSPQQQGQPFTLTVTARDCLDQLLTDERGPVRLTAHTGQRAGPISVLLFSRYLDASRSNGTLAALAHYVTNVAVESTAVIDPGTLAAQLATRDVFLVPAQSNYRPGNMAALGHAWAPVLNRFVRAGGVVIVCSDNYDEHELLSASGLLEAQKTGTYFPGTVTNTSTTRLTWGVPSSFVAPSITTYVPAQADVVLERPEDGLAVAAQRVTGAGATILLGTGFFENGSPMDRVLANAVAWNDGRADATVPLTPDTGLLLANGAWTGSVRLSAAAPELWLRADDDSGHAGLGNHFTVEALDSDADGMPDDWEDQFGLDKHSPSDAALDTDGDGLSNLEEFRAGTHPREASSVLRVTGVRLLGDSVAIEFLSAPGKFYRLESAASAPAEAWTVVADMVEGVGGPQTVLVSLPWGAALRFYRLQALVLSLTASQDLTDRAPFIILEPTDQVSQRGQSTRLEASAGGSMPLRYQWRFEGRDIPGATNLSFALDPVSRTNDGLYDLVVSNDYGTTQTRSAHLRVDQVLSWGNGDNTVPPGLSEVVAIAAGDTHRLAVSADGRVLGWGDGVYGQISPPADVTNAVAVAGGYAHSIALRADGTVVGWGSVALGQTDVPANLTNAVAIASGRDFCAALRRDGRVVAWGYNDEGQTNVPPWVDRVVAIACGMAHTVALRDDGTVVAWGVNWIGQSTVPPGLTNVVAIAAGGNHNLALRADGTVAAWGGDNSYGETTVPANLSDVVAIGAGYWHSLAVLRDGRVVGWGGVTIPPGLRSVRAVCGGWAHTVALVDDLGSP